MSQPRRYLLMALCTVGIIANYYFFRLGGLPWSLWDRLLLAAFGLFLLYELIQAYKASTGRTTRDPFTILIVLLLLMFTGARFERAMEDRMTPHAVMSGPSG